MSEKPKSTPEVPEGKISRRDFLGFAGATLAASALPDTAGAQEAPGTTTEEIGAQFSELSVEDWRGRLPDDFLDQIDELYAFSAYGDNSWEQLFTALTEFQDPEKVVGYIDTEGRPLILDEYNWDLTTCPEHETVDFKGENPVYTTLSCGDYQIKVRMWDKPELNV